MLNVIWAINIEVNPSFKPIATKNSIKAIPVTMSGFKTGRYVTFKTTVLVFFFITWIPMAANVPITVDITAPATLSAKYSKWIWKSWGHSACSYTISK